MMELYLCYGLFILYTFVVIILSGVIWLLLYFCGLAVVSGDAKTGIGGGRKYGAMIFIVAAFAQWILLCWCDTVIRGM